jgi:hypothetical protein
MSMAEKTPPEFLHDIDAESAAQLPLHYAFARPAAESACNGMGFASSPFHRTRSQAVVPFYKPISRALALVPRSTRK